MDGIYLNAKGRSIEEIVDSLRLLGCSEGQAQLHGQRLLKVRTAPRPFHRVRISKGPRGPRSRLFYSGEPKKPKHRNVEGVKPNASD
jgi:hypothetical protein